MRVIWSDGALEDIDRLYAFLVPKSPGAALASTRALLSAPNSLLEMPRMGPRVEKSPDREVRRIIIPQYEMVYQIDGDIIRILRVFHTREDR